MMYKLNFSDKILVPVPFSMTGLNQVQPVSEYLFPVFVKFQGLSDIFLIKLKLIGL